VGDATAVGANSDENEKGGDEERKRIDVHISCVVLSNFSTVVHMCHCVDFAVNTYTRDVVPATVCSRCHFVGMSH